MDQMTSHDLRPKIREDSLTFHPGTCPLSAIRITTQSRGKQAKQVYALGKPEWGLQLQKNDPYAMTYA